MDFSTKGKARVVAGTIAGTLFCIVVSLGVDAFGYSDVTGEQFQTYLTKDIFVPLFLGGVFFYILLEKIRQLAIAQEALYRLASIDGLTGALNRKTFTTLVDAWLEKARRDNAPRQGALLVIDADYFKKINDTYGHQAGDRALKHIAQTISVNVRESDLIGRVGGEEFAVFLPDVPEETAGQIAELIRMKVRELPALGESDGKSLSVSIGVVCFQRSASYDELFSVADRRLYDAKASGRNRVVTSSFLAAA